MAWYACDLYLYILYFYKYSCTNIFHGRSLYIFYSTCSQLTKFRPIQNDRHIADDIFNDIFLDENCINSDVNFIDVVPKGPINIILPLVQIMAWRRRGDKPLSGPVMLYLLRHKCGTQPK